MKTFDPGREKHGLRPEARILLRGPGISSEVRAAQLTFPARTTP
jgi:hypothetical protein